jgi:hypothetical protein
MPDRKAHHNPFEGITDLFTEFSRMREVGTRGGEPVPSTGSGPTPARGFRRPTSTRRVTGW